MLDLDLTAFRLRVRRVLRLMGWNAALFVAGLALVCVGAEVWLRETTPFAVVKKERRFVPGVGILLSPDAEVRQTNHLDYWVVERTNSLGFLDRESVSAERAEESCHIAAIGDSFVEAPHVPIADKFHVRLEELAARKLPDLDVTTSAFGISDLGQVNQLPLYDEFARHRHPRVLVLVFVPNDYRDNVPVVKALTRQWDPDRIPFVTAERDADGSMTLRPPFPHDVNSPESPRPWYRRVFGTPYLAVWLRSKIRALAPSLLPSERKLQIDEDARVLSRRAPYASLLDGWQPTTAGAMVDVFRQKDMPPYFEGALDFTAFALDEFKKRTERDGVSLVILATHRMRTRGYPPFDRLAAMAEARGIPVVDQYDYIRRQDARPRDANWAHDPHWNAAGHQWAAEAMLEYLEKNRDICTGS